MSAAVSLWTFVECFSSVLELVLSCSDLSTKTAVFLQVFFLQRRVRGTWAKNSIGPVVSFSSFLFLLPKGYSKDEDLGAPVKTSLWILNWLYITKHKKRNKHCRGGQADLNWRPLEKKPNPGLPNEPIFCCCFKIMIFEYSKNVHIWLFISFNLIQRKSCPFERPDNFVQLIINNVWKQWLFLANFEEKSTFLAWWEGMNEIAKDFFYLLMKLPFENNILK